METYGSTLVSVLRILKEQLFLVFQHRNIFRIENIDKLYIFKNFTRDETYSKELGNDWLFIAVITKAMTGSNFRKMFRNIVVLAL